MATMLEIPTPDKDILQSYKGRVGYFKSDTTIKLVFDVINQQWRIIDTSSYAYPKTSYVTFEEYEGGKKTVNPEAVKSIMGYTGDAADEVGTQSALAGATITMGPSGPVVNFTTPNKADPDGKPVVIQAYLYVTEKGVSLSPDEAKDGKITDKTFDLNVTDSVRDKHLEDLYKIYGNRQNIINVLYESRFLKTAKNVETTELISALENAVGEYSVNQIEAYKAGQIKQFATFNEWLTSREGVVDTGLTRTIRRTDISSKGDIRGLVREMYLELKERQPTDEEYKRWISKIQKKQERKPDLETVTYDEEGRLVSSKTKRGFNEAEYLFKQISEDDESNAVRLMSLYDAFRQARRSE